jgi:hypothetical protein
VRIRSIKPEFWRSEDVKRLPREIRLLFIGLWQYVDDNGVGIDDYRQIASDLFPIEDDPVEVREYVRDGLATLSRLCREGSTVPLIARYEIDGKRYLAITGWKHQRVDKPAVPRYPSPPDGWNSGNPDPPDGVAESSRDSRDTLVPVTGEQGNRGTGEAKTSTSADAGMFPDIQPPAVKVDLDTEFDTFWADYPLKKGKEPARKAFAKARKSGVTLETLRTGAAKYCLEVRGLDPSKVKWAQGWINDKRWQDYDEPGQPRLRAVSGGYQPYRNPTDQSVYDQPI